jgi:hypothetical protein
MKVLSLTDEFVSEQGYIYNNKIKIIKIMSFPSVPAKCGAKDEAPKIGPTV